MKYSDEWFYENGYFILQDKDVTQRTKPTTIITSKFRKMFKTLLVDKGKIIIPEEVEKYLDAITSTNRDTEETT